MNQLKYGDITGKILGAAFEVHKVLGNGFQEVIYQRALAYEMRRAGLEFAREIEQEIFYKDLQQPIGTRRADFVVEEKVLVELKALYCLHTNARPLRQMRRRPAQRGARGSNLLGGDH